MDFKPLALDGAYLITPPAYTDARGYFMVAYQQDLFSRHGLATDWVQDNQSLSRQRGIIRGFHFQTPPYAQAKLVRVLDGEVMDVIVDLRRSSPTFGQWHHTMLSAENRQMIYIPRGFGHAFQVVSDSATVLYKVDNVYAPDSQGGLIWNDPTLNVPWPVAQPLLSEKDGQLPALTAFESPFA